MRDPGQLWNDCHNGKIEEGRWEYQRKLVIGDVEYLDEDLLNVKFERGLMDRTISFGNSISATLKASILPHTRQIVNRNSPVIYYVRVIDLNDNVSPWVKFGEFYIDKAKNEFNRWNIECYDAMYKLEVNFPKGEYSSSEAVNIIARRMGVQIDSRTNMNVSFTIKNAQEYSMREVLGYIGSMNIGNWHITEEGKLKLTKLSIGKHVQSVLSSNSMNITGSDTMNFNKVTVKYSSNADDKYEAGNGDNEFEIFNPFANQGMADRLLSFFSNYTFFPGIIDSTEVNPAIELGDTIEIENNGVLFDINLINVSFSDRLYADIETPFDTDKLQDTFHFDAVGKDYDDVIQDHEDRITYLEAALGIGECMLVRKEELVDEFYMNQSHYERITGPGNRCLFLNKDVDRFRLKKYESIIVNDFKVMGDGLKDASYMFYGREDSWGITVRDVDLTKLDLSKVIKAESMFSTSSTAKVNSNAFKSCRSFNNFHRDRDLNGPHGHGEIIVSGGGTLKPDIPFTAKKAGYPITKVLDFSNCIDMSNLLGYHPVSGGDITVDMKAEKHIGFSDGSAMKDIIGLTRLRGMSDDNEGVPTHSMYLKLPKLTFKRGVKEIDFGTINLDRIIDFENVTVEDIANIKIRVIGGGVMPSFNKRYLKELSMYEDFECTIKNDTLDLSNVNFPTSGFILGDFVETSSYVTKIIISERARDYVKSMMYGRRNRNGDLVEVIEV